MGHVQLDVGIIQEMHVCVKMVQLRNGNALWLRITSSSTRMARSRRLRGLTVNSRRNVEDELSKGLSKGDELQLNMSICYFAARE